MRNQCTNQQPPQHGGAVPDPVWVGSKWLLNFPRVPVTTGTLLEPFFLLCSPLNDAEGQHTASLKSVACFLLFHALPRLLILLLLVSGNVHLNPGPIFPCSVFAANVTWCPIYISKQWLSKHHYEFMMMLSSVYIVVLYTRR